MSRNQRNTENELPVRDARENFSEVTNRCEYAGETFTITKHGRPVARIVPVDEQIRLTEEPERSRRGSR